MSSEPNTIEELTAYLDGELDPDSARRVEERLGSDPEYRAEMQSLQKTWDLFDRLPISQAGVSFTKTTMEMVVSDAVKQARKKSKRWWIWPSRIGVLIGLPLLLLVGGYFVTRRLQMEPNLQLVNNLLIIENFDRYQKVDKDIEFLLQLDDWGLFADYDSPVYDADVGALKAELFADTEPSESPSWETIEQRMSRISALNIEQKNELRRKNTEFTKLSPRQHQEFKEFHQQLVNHPDGKRLIRVMNSYYDWLKTLRLSEQARLLDLQPAKARLIEIANIRSQQAREAFGKAGSTALPTGRDAETLYDWYELTISGKEMQIRNQFATVLARYFEEKDIDYKPTDLQRFAYRRPIKQLVATLIGVDRSVIENLMLENVDLLRNALSFEARAILDEQPPAEQRELIFNWFEVANETKSSISPERLHEFYEQLPPERRDELDKMDPENWYRALEEQYRSENQSRQLRNPFGWEQDWQSLLDIYGLGEF